jgi:hypothetical protein
MIREYRHTGIWVGFMKHAAEMGSSVMTYIPSFIEIGSGIIKLIGGRLHIRLSDISFFYFSK